MEKKFNDNIRIKVDKDNDAATLSIKVNEYKVDVYKMSLKELKSFINNAYNNLNN